MYLVSILHIVSCHRSAVRIIEPNDSVVVVVNGIVAGVVRIVESRTYLDMTCVVYVKSVLCDCNYSISDCRHHSIGDVPPRVKCSKECTINTPISDIPCFPRRL